MKRVKICVVAVLLLITLSLTLLSGCSVNLEKINKKNAEAIAFGFNTKHIVSNDTSKEELKESINGYDYTIGFQVAKEVGEKYDYILCATKRKIDLKIPDIAIIKKNKTYLYPYEINNEYISLCRVDKSTMIFVAFIFLTQEQFDIITLGETKVANHYTEEVWNKALQVSDKIIEWNL